MRSDDLRCPILDWILELSPFHGKILVGDLSGKYQRYKIVTEERTVVRLLQCTAYDVIHYCHIRYCDLHPADIRAFLHQYGY